MKKVEFEEKYGTGDLHIIYRFLKDYKLVLETEDALNVKDVPIIEEFIKIFPLDVNDILTIQDEIERDLRDM